MRFLAGLALLGLAACTSLPDYYVMRHLQKADGPDPALSAEGRANAAEVPQLLITKPPRAIYVSTTRRARETAAAVAKTWNITPQEYDPRDTPALIARLSQEKGPVLVVGHSNTVPDIVKALSGDDVGPMREDEYGTIFYVTGPMRGDKRAVIWMR